MSVDPLDTSQPLRARQNSYAESYAGSYDFAATGEIPLEIHKTRSRRDSRLVRPLNRMLGRTEEVSSEDETTTPDAPFDGAIQEKDETDAGEDKPLEKVQTTKSERHKRNKQAFHNVAFMFLKVYMLVLIIFVGVLSIYWGSLYNRSHYLKNLHYLVVVDDAQIGQLPPLIGSTLTQVFNSTNAASVGSFHFMAPEELAQSAAKHDNTIYEEVVRKVHHQKYWGAIYVKQNATLDYYTALKTQDASFNNTYIDFIYETGRNPSAVSSYVLSVVQGLERAFVPVASKYVAGTIIDQLNSTEKVLLSQKAPNLISNFWFDYIDNRPMLHQVISGPIQLGMVYLVVMSFHQFNFASATHAIMREKLHLKQYLVYHYLTSHLSYVLMALVYSLMILAFRVNVRLTFGSSGFLVNWAFVYLTMASLGGVSENVALWIFTINKAYIGFWVVFWLVVNMVSIFNIVPLMNDFYRWSYATPLYNGQELLKVVFLNTYKGNMGRNIGVLLCWIAVGNIALPFTLKWTKIYAKKVEQRALDSVKK